MLRNCTSNLSRMPNDPKDAIRNVTENLFEGIYPLMLGVRKKLQQYKGPLGEGELSKLQDVYALCISQIKKCLQNLFDILRTEYHEQVFLQESRQYTIERLSWCINRLYFIEEKLEVCTQSSDATLDNSMLTTPMYFVNWIDHTFDVLSKLSNMIYNTDHKRTDTLYDKWKIDLAECVSSLYLALDELLLSAMTLCRYCLPSDQLIVKARCQVVLRETKALLSELVEGDINSIFKVTKEFLKLPIMPSNVNVLIDVLKDVLYALETNTNTALLTLVVYCFNYNIVPVDVLRNHFMNANATCSCLAKNDGEVTEDCSYVKDFDLYNERLLQIGSFAVSCSSDQSRILVLRSGLASLEALDPQLVPALMLSPSGHHAALLVQSWRQEVRDIRDSIFLIVDPGAFAEKTKQMMHQTLLEITQSAAYDNVRVCSVINIACVVLDFFSVYNRLEPDALTQHEKLVPLLENLDKVQMECKVVSNLLSSGEDFVYNIKISKNKEVSVAQLIKRLKLLYTLVSRINSLLHPKENEELFDCEVEEEVPLNNVTHNVLRKNVETYVLSPRKAFNISRSTFVRMNVRSSTNNFPLHKLTKHLQAKRRDELSFSLQLDDIFNLSGVKGDCSEKSKRFTKQLESLREPSILYNFSPKKRNSLRKAVLNKHCKFPFDSGVCSNNVETVEISKTTEVGSLMDEATSLQITEILNQMSDMTNTFARQRSPNATFTQSLTNQNKATTSKVLSINVNCKNNTSVGISKHIWNIPVNASSVEVPLDDTSDTLASNITTPSNITTLERINDIDLVESKLNNLRTDLETSL